MQITYYPKGGTQTFGIFTFTPDTYVSTRTYPIMVVGHGIGERGPGTLASLTTISNWGGFANFKTIIDKYDIVQVYVQTANNYELGEIEYARTWALANLSCDPTQMWYWGNSLGWFGGGNQVFGLSVAECQKWTGTINTVSGPYTAPNVSANIANSGIKYWGVTATNDTFNGTNPSYTRQVYDQGKAVNANAPIIVTEYPIGTFADGAAHGGCLSRVSWDGVAVAPTNTRGLPAGNVLMNFYQWILSNPKGGVYKPPTLAYTGPAKVLQMTINIYTDNTVEKILP